MDAVKSDRRPDSIPPEEIAVQISLLHTLIDTIYDILLETTCPRDTELGEALSRATSLTRVAADLAGRVSATADAMPMS